MSGKILRIIAIILMGMASAMMFLGGIGTICIAFWPEKYPTLAMMARVKPIFQVAAILTILAGLWGGWTTFQLRRFTASNHRRAVLILVLSLATAIVKMYFSSRLRGSVAPTNIRFYLSLGVLIYFLILRLPGLWQRVENSSHGPDEKDNEGLAAAAFLAGALILTVQYWAGPTHTINGINYADVWHWPLTILAWALMTGGLSFGIRRSREPYSTTPSHVININ